MAGVVVTACAVAGCADNGQNTLHTDSPQARDIEVLWWAMLGVASVIFLGAVAMLVLAALRRGQPGLPVVGEREGLNQRLVVTFGILVPIVILVALFVASNIGVMGATAAPEARTTQLEIQVIGHQWWWEVRYPGTPGAVTANELHIPAGVRVNVVATTADVIHSFWVPELNRKIDMVPDRRNRVLLYARRPGVFRGQCAEFCGLQHAHMAFRVIAEPRAAFDRWVRAQAAPATAPQGADAVAGERVLMGSSCAACHRIRGTPAQGRVGPDLTHVGSRPQIAALTTANTPQRMFAWITDPQHVKPGVRMPAVGLSRHDFRQVVAYLEGLR